MDLLGQMKMADFLFKLYRGDMDRLAGYPFVPQKKHTIPLWDKADQMPRATPEQEGISSCHGNVGYHCDILFFQIRDNRTPFYTVIVVLFISIGPEMDSIAFPDL